MLVVLFYTAMPLHSLLKEFLNDEVNDYITTVNPIHSAPLDPCLVTCILHAEGKSESGSMINEQPETVLPVPCCGRADGR